MSKEQANAFRKFVNENESVQEQIKAAASDESFSLVALAAKHGYEFTEEEAQSEWEGELSESELENLSGGMVSWVLAWSGCSERSGPARSSNLFVDKSTGSSLGSGPGRQGSR